MRLLRLRDARIRGRVGLVVSRPVQRRAKRGGSRHGFGWKKVISSQIACFADSESGTASTSRQWHGVIKDMGGGAELFRVSTRADQMVRTRSRLEERPETVPICGGMLPRH